VDSSYASVYRELYQRHWWWRAREIAVLRILRQQVPAGGWHRVLDVGCGDGLLFGRLHEFAAEFEGVEPDLRLLSRPNPNIHVGPFDATFRPGEPYDAILMLDVLEHMDNPVDALVRAQELLVPNGVLVITVPALMLLWTSHDVINHHRIRYSRQSFGEIAAAAGLQLILQRYLFQWTCPLKVVQGRLERLFGSRLDNPTVPPAGINGLLLGLSVVENWLASYLPFPFGSSLLVVARAGATTRAKHAAMGKVGL
jgi:SAM-dependent methyltransferase